MVNSSRVVEAAGNYTGSINYSEAVELVSRPESAEQAVALYQNDPGSLGAPLAVLALTPFAVMLFVGAILELWEDEDYWVLFFSGLVVVLMFLVGFPFLAYFL
ncbi:hypothetical protein ACM16X_02785 [Haloarcula japonica]|uniref:hypothetical protein n=1 Tax=Haloarcula japonica TaxID=29282 RepID=UPI0039F73B96